MSLIFNIAALFTFLCVSMGQVIGLDSVLAKLKEHKSEYGDYKSIDWDSSSEKRHIDISSPKRLTNRSREKKVFEKRVTEAVQKDIGHEKLKQMSEEQQLALKKEAAEKLLKLAATKVKEKANNKEKIAARKKEQERKDKELAIENARIKAENRKTDAQNKIIKAENARLAKLEAIAIAEEAERKVISDSITEAYNIKNPVERKKQWRILRKAISDYVVKNGGEKASPKILNWSSKQYQLSRKLAR
jgi:hypothetical protein